VDRCKSLRCRGLGVIGTASKCVRRRFFVSIFTYPRGLREYCARTAIFASKSQWSKWRPWQVWRPVSVGAFFDFLREMTNCAKLSPGVLRSWYRVLEFLNGVRNASGRIKVVHGCKAVLHKSRFAGGVSDTGSREASQFDSIYKPTVAVRDRSHTILCRAGWIVIMRIEIAGSA
jgi:hypothetical protein